MAQIKLTPKQLSVLQQIQTQKSDLTRHYQILSDKENIVLELVFEDHGITTGEVTNIKLSGNSLEYDHKTAPAKPEIKRKKVKAEPEKV